MGWGRCSSIPAESPPDLAQRDGAPLAGHLPLVASPQGHKGQARGKLLLQGTAKVCPSASCPGEPLPGITSCLNHTAFLLAPKEITSRRVFF